MTAIAHVKEYLAHIPEGKAFPSNALRRFTTTENVRQILGRLVKTGELRRVARGIFVKPKYVSKIGEILPSASEIAEILAKSTGETITIQGAEAARQLQLTTQVPMRLIFYTSGNTRTLKIINLTVKLKHVSPSRLVAPGTIPGLVISALYYLGRENVTIMTVEMIKQRISSEEFNATINLIERMPTWMSDIFYRYQQEKINE
ncbi:MAG: hypothetical protein JSS53_00415 [Proteobacteria bacterium]|nr:hypothetical protein [Pseudomonadota bacterium]